MIVTVSNCKTMPSPRVSTLEELEAMADVICKLSNLKSFLHNWKKTFTAQKRESTGTIINMCYLGLPVLKRTESVLRRSYRLD